MRLDDKVKVVDAAMVMTLTLMLLIYSRPKIPKVIPRVASNLLLPNGAHTLMSHILSKLQNSRNPIFHFPAPTLRIESLKVNPTDPVPYCVI